MLEAECIRKLLCKDGDGFRANEISAFFMLL